jgi:hypothetical protein
LRFHGVNTPKEADMNDTPLRFAPLLAAALLSTGCATVFLSAHDDLKVVTDPSGATARVGELSVVTPGVLEVPRNGKPVVVEIDREGYESREIPIRRTRSGAVWTNLVGIGVGAVVGVTTALFVSIVDQNEAEKDLTTALAVGGALTATGFAIDLSTDRTLSLERDEIVVRLERRSEPVAVEGALR